MDWRVGHGIYFFSLHHHWVGSLFHGLEAASIPFMVIVTCALSLFARPDGNRKWKLAATSGLVSAALALVANTVIHTIWDRPRPYESHSFPHPWSVSTDASFPSDHTSASFAIAFAVFMYDRLVGGLFLLAAVLIGAGRLFIAAHYPADVGAGVLVGLASALLVARFGQPLLRVLVRLVERVTDPLLRPLWRLRRA